MVKWLPFTLLLAGATFLSAQWTQTAGQYPQSQYPQQSQDPQSQYPDNTQPQNQYPQQGQPSADTPDPADLQHGVARISIAQGDVNIRRGDNGQLTGAVINTPLVTHDHLQTSPGSRAEVQLDAGTLLRLAPDTDLTFANLEYHRVQAQLGLGTIIFRVLQSTPTQIEIDTPSIGIHALAPGEYRISVFDNGTSQISVHAGELEVYGPHGSERLEAGRSIMVRGDASDPEMQDVNPPPPLDQFDQWSQQRDREFSPAQSYQYVNADMQGAHDLDQYGNWVPSGYGQAWRPQGVASDWSPYSDGQWSYVDYYGWSWIDSAPWGWAPYHYGRWFWNTGYGWCWWPGERLRPAYWSPALVGFFGVGAGGFGWVALAPFERFHPWWGHFGFGFGYGGFGLGGYHNAAFRGGALVASLNGFGGVRQRFAMANRSQIMSARSISGRLPVTATRASYNYSNRQAVPNNRFASVQSRSFFHQSTPARSFGAGSGSGIRNYSTGTGGWQHFGSMGQTAGQSFRSNEASPWHNFGQSAPRANSYQSTPRSYSQPSRSYQSAAPRPSYNYSEPRQSYSAPRQNYSAPRQEYSAPHQNYSAPRQEQSRPSPAPRSNEGSHGSGSAPHGGGGGGSHGGGGHHGR